MTNRPVLVYYKINFRLSLTCRRATSFRQALIEEDFLLSVEDEVEK